MTDARTDEIADAAANMAAIRPWIFVNRRSRLVVDPERFPDPADEPMAAPEIGMGAVYTRTSHGGILRDDEPDHHEALLDRKAASVSTRRTRHLPFRAPPSRRSPL